MILNSYFFFFNLFKIYPNSVASAIEMAALQAPVGTALNITYT